MSDESDHVPASPVDNNPRRVDRAWQPACEEERQWLSAHPHVRLIDNPGDDRTHGAGLDLALAWCRTQAAIQATITAVATRVRLAMMVRLRPRR